MVCRFFNTLGLWPPSLRCRGRVQQSWHAMTPTRLARCRFMGLTPKQPHPSLSCRRSFHKDWLLVCRFLGGKQDTDIPRGGRFRPGPCLFGTQQQPNKLRRYVQSAVLPSRPHTPSPDMTHFFVPQTFDQHKGERRGKLAGHRG